jgi:hypothetical protein
VFSTAAGRLFLSFQADKLQGSQRVTAAEIEREKVVLFDLGQAKEEEEVSKTKKFSGSVEQILTRKGRSAIRSLHSFKKLGAIISKGRGGKKDLCRNVSADPKSETLN